MAEIFSAISLALTIIDRLQAYYEASSATIPADVEHAKVLLGDIHACLQDVGKKIDRGSKDMLTQQHIKTVENMAYDIEDAVTIYLQHISNNGDRRGLSKKMQKAMSTLIPGNDEVHKATIKFSAEIVRIKNERGSCDKLEAFIRNDIDSTASQYWLDKDSLASGADVVGSQSRNLQLLNWLYRSTDKPTILITGPGGSGKSTLAKDIYGIALSKEKFNCHAWIHLPDKKLEKQLLMILDRTKAQRLARHGNDDIFKEKDTKENLKGLLHGKKFLLVLDNVWREEELEIVRTLVPEVSDGSRIIITSRRSDVSSSSSLHDLSGGLSNEQARILFSRLAFGMSESEDGSFPYIVKNWAEVILNMCDGMPLEISTIGTSLFNMLRVPADWKTFHDTLGSQICNDESELHVLFRNLQPSYRELQSSYKTCFLYFSMFPHNLSISRKRLTRLWVAEGFVMSNRTQQAEEIADDILDKLIKRNLVVAKTMEVDGRLVRGYRVLHLVREINILRGENFLTVLEPNCNVSSDKIRRVSVNKGDVESIKGRTAGIRTLLVFELENNSSIHLLQKILKTCKFLRVLDLQGLTALVEFPSHVVDLTLLKYLSLKKTQVQKVPKSIKKLVNLETLDLRQTNVNCLPSEICYLLNLRHLLVFCKNVSNGGVDLSSGDIAALSSMQSLSCIKVGSNTSILTALSKLTHLRKLRLTDIETENAGHLCTSLKHLGKLSTLDVRAATADSNLNLGDAPEYLKCLHMEGRLADVPIWIPKLTSLKKITLKWSKLTHVNEVHPLEPLQCLENLMELDLVDYCSGEQLVFATSTFSSLSVLRMEQFDQLKAMIIENMAMPQLKELTMSRCRNLKKLPEGIGSLTLLEKVKCRDMDAIFETKLRVHGEKMQLKLDLA